MQSANGMKAVFFRIGRNKQLLRLLAICLLVSSFCIVSIWIVSSSRSVAAPSIAGMANLVAVPSKSWPVKQEIKQSAIEATKGAVASEAAKIAASKKAVAKASANTTHEKRTVKPKTTTTTDVPLTTITPPSVPVHIKDLFAVKELNLVALDPVLLTCITTGKCMHVTASTSIQLGTWLKNTEEFQKVFKRHFKDAAWKLEVICPHAAVITKHYWRGFDKKIALSVIQDDPEKHYLKIEMEKNAEIEERAFDRFNTTQLLGLTVPSDIPRFELWWRNGRFLNCNETLAEKFVANSSIIQEIHIQNFKIFTDMLLASGQIPTLAFGTLLGWYRNCGVIPYTTDIDINIRVSEYQDDFMEGLKKRQDFRLLRYIGAKEYGLEITVKIPGIVKDAYVDVFYLFPHNSTYDWVPTTYGKSSGWVRLKTLVPKYSDDDFCTGDIMGYLFFLPCNFMDVIVTSYGKTDWLEPQENYGYTGHDRLTFSDGHWNET
ncbi:hypothetical protein L596_009583 [Steinernema carpocapsae]|uniref:Fukutin n=1 Tax=Steinernema carpocapsae TaxID=34508 RepID=A0A4U5PFS1_STECR|nr:hypothetical protein L596_009583 [Steinernema carpocapsae]